MVIFLVCAFAGQCQAESNERMTIVKAGLVNGISGFTTWPNMSGKGSLVVCMLAEDSDFGDALLRFNEKKRRNNDYKIQIDVVSVDNFKHCHLVVVLGNQNRQSSQLLTNIGRSPILTVSDDPQFTANGGHISFFSENNRLRFEINYQATINSGLKISSRLLKLARVINKQ